MNRLSVVAFALLCALVQPVLAGPIDEAKSKAHLEAVAAGDLDALMRDYAEDAYMDWIGGPLDGRYRGKKAIAEVWRKFIAANGGKPRPAKFGTPQSFANPAGTSVETEAAYGGTTPVKAWHVLVFRDGVLSTEIWQIAPKINLAP
jgi:hypothetical protein